MRKNMRLSKNVKNTFEITSSPHGKGYLHITDSGIYFESLIYGRVLSLEFDIITRYGIQGRQFRIDWITNGAKLYYVLTTPSPKRILSTYQRTNEEYARSAQK
jgi:hypothetical protein